MCYFHKGSGRILSDSNDFSIVYFQQVLTLDKKPYFNHYITHASANNRLDFFYKTILIILRMNSMINTNKQFFYVTQL